MGIFDSIKSAFSKTEEADVTVSPSQMLREAGINPAGLKFGFGTGSISVTGEVADEASRQKILDVLTTVPNITEVQDGLTIAAPEPVAEPAPPAPAEPEAAPAAEEPAAESAEADSGDRSYTVESGDTLWKIAEQMYGSGNKYMEIFNANKDLLENPDRIFPGQTLKIPTLEE